MTNLEFIEKQIDAYKRLKERAILNISDEEDDDELFKLQERIDIINERLPILQQIKTELEAWEIAKSKRVSLLDIELSFDIEDYNDHLGNQYRLTKTEYQTVKKALEAKNVKNKR